MNKEKLKEIISNGESITVEFKESKNKLNRDVYESVCSLLNRHGGHLILGVRDNGEIIGVDSESADQMKKDFVTSINNPQNLNPSFYLAVDEIIVDGKTILYINMYIPTKKRHLHGHLEPVSRRVRATLTETEPIYNIE